MKLIGCDFDDGLSTCRIRKSVNDGVLFTTLTTISMRDANGLYSTLDEQNIVVVFDAGSGYGYVAKIYRSANGGISFSLVFQDDTPSGIKSLAVSPADDNYMWAVGKAGKVYKSLDNGINWTLFATIAGYSSSEYLESVSFISNMVGWTSGKTKIFKTTDGGENWVEQKDVGAGVTVIDVFALDANTVWALEGALTGKVWKTIDGGTNWTSFVTPRVYAGGKLYALGDKVWFTGKSGVNLEVIYSNDGGSNWNRTTVTDTYAGEPLRVKIPLVFASENIGYLANYRCFKTIDGGQTFSQLGIFSGASTSTISDFWVNKNLVTEWRSFDVAGVAPTNRTTEGSAISEANPLNFGSVGPGNNSNVKVLVFRATSLGIYTTISDMRAWLQAKALVGTNFYYMDITDTWTINKTPGQVAAGTPGTCPQSLPGVANLTKIGGGDITGVGHADTSQYVYVCQYIGDDEVGGVDIDMNYRVQADKA